MTPINSNITVTLPVGQVNWITETADKRGVSRSAFIRWLVAHAIAHNLAPPPKIKPRTSDLSELDVMTPEQIERQIALARRLSAMTPDELADYYRAKDTSRAQAP